MFKRMACVEHKCPPCENKHAICMILDRNVERRGSDDLHEAQAMAMALGAATRDRSIHLRQGGVLVKTSACASKVRPMHIEVLSDNNHGPPIVGVGLRINLVMRAIRENMDALELTYLEVRRGADPAIESHARSEE